MTHTELIARVGDAVKARFSPDPRALEALEEALLGADVGPATAAELVEAVRAEAGRRDAGEEDVVRRVLKEEITRRLSVPAGANPGPSGGAPRRPRRRRERDREDDHGGEARRPRRGGGGVGRPRRRRHVPRRGHRAARDLGEPAERSARLAQAGGGPGGGRPRRLHVGEGAEGRPSARRHGGTAPHEAQPDGGAGEDPADRGAGGAGRSPRGAPRPRRGHGPERSRAGARVHEGVRRHGPRPDEDGRDGEGGRHPRDRPGAEAPGAVRRSGRDGGRPPRLRPAEFARALVDD